MLQLHPRREARNGIMATRTPHTPSILLVSNSIDERELCTRAPNGRGYEVVTATTTVLAYRIATTTPTDMVITVAHCAGSMSGLELMRRLRLHTRTTAVPIIVLTTETRCQDGELSITAGADMFLERPVSGDVLREHVVRLLVASGRMPHQSSPHQHERVSFESGATSSRQRAQAPSSSQARTDIFPCPRRDGTAVQIAPWAGTPIRSTPARVRNVGGSWNIGRSGPSCRRSNGTVVSHGTGRAMCLAGSAATRPASIRKWRGPTNKGARHGYESARPE
jgi:CheY-like chemotaxis protein